MSALCTAPAVVQVSKTYLLASKHDGPVCLLHFPWGDTYSGHGHLCCLSDADFPHYCTDPDATWENGRNAL